MRRDNLLHSAFMMFLGSLLAWGLVAEAWATDVTLRLLDQNGALISASQFEVLTPPGGTVQNGGTISLPAGTHTIRLFPGLNGLTQGGDLYRDESVSVSGSTQTINSVWVTASLQLNLVDQNNVPILQSRFSVAYNDILDGASIVLPVTDDPATPPINGSFAAGYGVRLFPGINGHLQGSTLYRDEPPAELTATGLVRTFVWVTATLRLQLFDQNNALYPACQFFVAGTDLLTNDASVVFPVTDDPNTTPISGTYANGYEVVVFPGIDGRRQAHLLQRTEPAQELTATGALRTFIWATATLRLQLFDQNNVLYPACQFFVAGTDLLTNDASVVFPVTDDPNTTPISGTYANGYEVTVFPGIDGRRQAHLLQRTEPAQELTATGLLRTFVWVTATLQLQLFDQNNVLYPACQFFVAGTDLLTNDASVVFPVTDDPNTTPISGIYVNGYEVTVFPGIDGRRQAHFLQRTEPAAELTAKGLLRIFGWVTATLRLQLFDQNNVLYPACQFFVAGTDLLTNDASVVFPVTDDPNTTPISGIYANGYEVTVFPGINGQRQAGFLERTESTAELTSTGLLRTFVWEMAKGNLHVVDASESEVTNGKINQPYLGTITTGTCISLPITDNTIYPNIAGRYANGYDDFYIQTAAANPFEGPFTFKFLSNKVIDPAFVTLAGGMHGLRFDLMTPTTLAAHAGDDQAICAGQSVTIGGNPTATGGTPNYSYSWTPTAGLNNATVANPIASPVATMIYTVEVTDATGCKATDAMTVTVNSVTTVTFNPVGPFCLNAAAVDLSGFVSPAGGTFSGPGISGTSFNPSAAGAGTHTITYTVTTGGCSNSKSQNIVVNALPVANAGSDQTINAGQTVQIGGSPTASGGNGGPYTISWSPATGLDNPSAANPNASPTSTTTYTVTVTENTTGCKATDQVTVNLQQPPPSGKAFVFLAGEDVTIDRQGVSEGNIHANNDIIFKKGSPSTYKGDLTAVDDIIIGSKNSITGNATAGDEVDVASGSTVSGTITEDAAVATEPLPNPSFSAGGNDINVPQNGTVTLAPGSYDDVTVNKKGTLKLSSGDYFLDKLELKESAKLVIDVGAGPVNINVVEKLSFEKKVVVSITPAGDAGSPLVSFTQLDDDRVTIGESARVVGNVIAVDAEVRLSKSSRFKGAICAEKIVVDQGAVFLPHGSSTPLPKSSEIKEFEVAESEVVTGYELAQNYPNPFNPSTVISFQLPENSDVKLVIYSITGQLVRELVSGEMNAGRHAISWDGRDRSGNTVAAGMYLYRLVARGENGEVVFAQTRRMALVK